ncbi:MAG: SAF domain-containing protein, partial [Ruthenibacterium sp.]
LKAMVQEIRNTEAALGSDKKQVTQSEAKNKPIARKSIVAKRNIAKDEVYTAENLTVKRPGDGISPMRWYDVLGKTAPRDFGEDEEIEL